MRSETVRLATRGSELAVRQANVVKSALEDRRRDVELVEVETTGDLLDDELIHRLGRTGAFVRSLDERVLDGRVDAAVHSMKDMPTELPDDLVVAAIPERATPLDVLVTPDGSTIDDLPEGATVGTSSLRRRAQLLTARPDLSIVPLRGNVDTRIEKLLAPHLGRERARLSNGDDDDSTIDDWLDGLSALERRALDRDVETSYDAIVLAAAGLERTGLSESVETSPLPVDRFVPAPGQGALAVTMRDTDLASRVNQILDNPRIRVETTVERTVLARLGGGCIAPIGVYAVVKGEHVRTRVQVLDPDGTNVVATTRDLPVTSYAAAARELADDLAGRGARDLVDGATGGGFSPEPGEGRQG